MNMEEIWKDIKDYEGLYQVSNLGRVKSLWFGKEKILKGNKIIKGYLQVDLYKNGKGKMNNVHRLVAEAFIPNPNNYPCINHKDENPANNCVENLEWCTYQYNNTYGDRLQKMVKNTDWKLRNSKIDYNSISDKLKNRQDLSKPVLQFTKDGEFIMEWNSTAECGRNGFDCSAVSKCCRGVLKKHKGFIWRYKND